MSIISGLNSFAGPDIICALRAHGFPLDQLVHRPVSAIENVAVETGGLPRGVCGVGCLGCCANAASPQRPGVVRLSPELLGRILRLAQELAKTNLHILSTIRLTLYNGSNELDNPDCISLRRLLSAFSERTYGFPLGAISSDLVFHISGSPLLEGNLTQLVGMPLLWDNICLSIDEQVPWPGEQAYTAYVDRLAAVWKVLRPALSCQLVHAKAARLGGPRVILNMLVPEDGSVFRPEYQYLYPGGLPRAVRFRELIERYVNPFVGNVVETTSGTPDGHKFTSAIAQLSEIPGSSVYLACNRYVPTGRGGALVRWPNGVRRISPGAINTKIYPAGENRFRFKACFTTAQFADDEIAVTSDQQPPWFKKLNTLVIDLGSSREEICRPKSAEA